MASTPWLDPEKIRFMLEECDTWAVVGLSGDPHRTAFRISEFLQSKGKRIVPIHPKAPVVHGEQGYATLAEVPFPIDVVDPHRVPRARRGQSQETFPTGAGEPDRVAAAGQELRAVHVLLDRAEDPGQRRVGLREPVHLGGQPGQPAPAGQPGSRQSLSR